MAGEVDVDAMLRRIPARLWKEWQVFYRLEPFDEHRREMQLLTYQVALISQMLANINRDVKKHPQTYKLEEFVIKLEEEVQEKNTKPLTSKQIQEQQHNLMKVMAAMHGNNVDMLEAEAMLRAGVTAKGV